MRARFMMLSAVVIPLVAVTMLVPSLTLARELAHSRALSGAQRLANDLTPVVAAGGDADPAVVDINAKGRDQVRVLMPDGSLLGYGRSSVPRSTLDRVRREARSLEVRTDEGGVLLQPVPRGNQGMAIVEVTFRNADMTRDVAIAWAALSALAAVTVAFGLAVTHRFTAKFRARPRHRATSPGGSAGGGARNAVTRLLTPRRRQAGGASHRRSKIGILRRHKDLLGWAAVGVCAVVVGAQAFLGPSARGTREVDETAAGPDSVGMTGIPTSPLPTLTPIMKPSEDPSESPSASRPPKRTKTPRQAPRTTAPPSPSRTPSPKPRRRTPHVTIDSPAQGTEVHGQVGVLLIGRATGLGRNHLRLFEYAPDGLFYIVDEGPVPVHDGRWRFQNGTIGAGTQDVGKVFRTIAVIANPTCQRTLAAAVPNAEGNVTYRTLPAGCREADSVRVRKVAP